MVKRLIVSKQAYFDIDRIIAFNDLRNRSNVYSKKFVKHLFKVFKLLSKQPTIGKLTNVVDILLLVWDDYYIFYSIDGDNIIINAINHQKENINV